jgi:hypothetical protein
MLIASEQGRADQRFQLANLMAQGRLANVKALGGMSYAEIFGDGNEIVKQSEVHEMGPYRAITGFWSNSKPIIVKLFNLVL